MTKLEKLSLRSTLTQDVWNKKYRYNGESFDEYIDRISLGDDRFRSIIGEAKFIPGGRISANVNTDTPATYSNCYSLGRIPDSIEGIWETARDMARTFSYGGGVGISVSDLRPKGYKVNNAAKTTTGAVSFMELLDVTTKLIGQNGRRAALMISMSAEHPDILDFINIKKDGNKINNANLSVEVTDQFMFGVMHKREKETKVYEAMIQNTWEANEPGIMFIDTMRNRHLSENIEEFTIDTTNPCGEIPLQKGGACLLGAINLPEFVNEDKEFDINEYRKAVMLGYEYLDTVLDLGADKHPLAIQREQAKLWRNLGLGVSGVADMFIKMGIVYGSWYSIEFLDMLMRETLTAALFVNIKRAKELGPMKAWREGYAEEVINCSLLQDLKEEVQEDVWDYIETGIRMYGLRNISMLTIQPLGTGSLLLNTSNGIEPYFKLKPYIRKTESLNGVTRYYPVDEADIYKEYKDKVAEKVFIEAGDIPFRNRLTVQAAMQKWIDNSISSTVNLHRDTTVEEIRDLYLEAWKLGLKGTTTFRPGGALEGVLIEPPVGINTYDMIVEHVKEMNKQVEQPKLSRAELVNRLKK